MRCVWIKDEVIRRNLDRAILDALARFYASPFARRMAAAVTVR
jgi:hypothetical protein